MDRKAVVWDLKNFKKQKRSKANAAAEEFAQQVRPNVPHTHTYAHTPTQITPLKTCEGHTMKISAIVAKPDRFITAGRDCLILAWGWDGILKWKCTGHMGPVNCLGVMGPSCIRGYNPGKPEEDIASKASAASGPKPDAVLAPPQHDTDILVSCCGGGLLKCWTPEGKQVLTKKLHEAPIETLSVDGVRHIAITGSWDHVVSIFNTV